MRRLVAGLIAAGALTLTACRPEKSATIVPDPSLMTLVPADTQIITGVRVEELKKTKLYSKYVAEKKLAFVDQFRNETGIDPRKDIFDIVFASNGKSAVAFVRGKFVEGGQGAAGLEPKLEREGVRRFQHGGYTLYGDERVAVAFFNTSVAVAGPTPMVRAIIDGRDGSKGRAPEALIARIKQIPSSNQVYAVSRAGFQGTLPADLAGPLAGLKSMPFDIRSIVATLDVSEGVKFASQVESGDEKSAGKMHDAMRGLIGIARLSTPNDRMDLLKFYDAVDVRQDKTSVRVAADVPMDLFDRMLEMLQERRLAARAN